MQRTLIIGGLLLATAAVILIIRLGGLFFDQAPKSSTAKPVHVETAAADLEIPWEIAFTPDGRALITERPGRVRVLRDGKVQPESLLELTTVPRGEGGLQGLALDPDFAANKLVYLYASYRQGDTILNRVVQYEEIAGAAGTSRLVERRVLLDGIPGNTNHNGGRLAFGPDGKLYIATGDAQQPDLAQDRDSLAGKILRLNRDGSLPPDNPFGNAVWSYGHRNPQGLAWDERGRMYIAEHGPSGDLGLCCRDEINRIERGANYGWPVISGNQTRPGMHSPLVQSGNQDTWAPAGLAYHDGRLYLATLRGEHLRSWRITNSGLADEQILLAGEYGRMRAAVWHGDELYVTTSNRDGRGTVQDGDDKLLRVKLK